MLARRMYNGDMEIRRGGRVLARVAAGDIYCYNCDLVIPIERTENDTADGVSRTMVYNHDVSARSEE